MGELGLWRPIEGRAGWEEGLQEIGWPDHALLECRVAIRDGAIWEQELWEISVPTLLQIRQVCWLQWTSQQLVVLIVMAFQSLAFYIYR